MQTALGILGLFLVYLAVMMRLQRWEDYRHDLQFAEREKKDAEFWGWDPKEEDETLERIKQEGYGTRWQRFKFNLGFLALAITGAVILLVLYLNSSKEDTTWIGPFAAVMLGLGWLQFTYGQSIEKLEREVRWLHDTLKQVKERADRALRREGDDGLGKSNSLQHKLDDLDQGGASLGEILDAALREQGSKPPPRQ